MARNYRQFHALLNKQPGVEIIGKDELKYDLISQFSNGRTQDVKSLTDNEFWTMINTLKNNSVDTQKLDKLRKRVLASMFAFFKLIDKPVNITYVKAIAVRAAGSDCKNFNAIGESKLRAIYNEFLRQQKVVNNIGKIEAISKMDASLLSMCGIEVKVQETKGVC